MYIVVVATATLQGPLGDYCTLPLSACPINNSGQALLYMRSFLHTCIPKFNEWLGNCQVMPTTYLFGSAMEAILQSV